MVELVDRVEIVASGDGAPVSQEAPVLSFSLPPDLPEWQKRDVARKVAKAARNIWTISQKSQLPRLARMAELMFYEAYGRAGGKVEPDTGS